MNDPVQPWRRYTQILLCVTFILLCCWDILVYRKAGVRATISRVCWDWAKAYPGWLIALGILLGHLFFSQSLPPEPVQKTDSTEDDKTA